MAYGLLGRILAHAGQEGWIAPGSVIVDPFGGIGSTGILGAYEGCRVVCCELEQRFVDLAEANFKLHDNAWRKLGCPRPVMIQGDSRKLAELIAGCDLIVSSPPYATGDSASAESITHRKDKSAQWIKENCGSACTQGYGSTPGQLGAMRPGSVDAVVSSPPYAETLKGDGTQSETAAESRAKRLTDGGSLGQSQRTQGYGSKGNLGNLKPGRIDAIISSPPWEKGAEGVMRAGKFNNPEAYAKVGMNKGHGASFEATIQNMKRSDSKASYGNTAGNIGNSQGETFWSAARIIVEQCHQILREGGVAIWVTKRFIRNSKIQEFTQDWIRLCESVGFEVVHQHRAMLVKEQKHKTLFGHTEVKRTERKSFFRRLCESKGSPRIDWEDVICCKKGNT
jgi:hypothetical protein